MLWVVFAIICLAVLALLLVPVLKGGREVRARVDYDIVVYRSQLAEIDQEIEEGLLSSEQAEAARTEVHRRMLAAEDAELKAPLRLFGGNRISRLGAAVVIAVVLPLGALALYAVLGSPSLPGKPYLWRVHNDPQFASSAIGEKLMAEVQANPTAAGFEQLGRAFFAARQYEQAAAAYRHATQMGATDAVTWSEFGEALVMSASGSVVPEAITAFSNAITAEPKSERSRFYLGLAEAQIGNLRQAVAIWRDLEKTSDPAAPWMPMLREHIAAYAKQGGFDPASVPPSPPDVKAMGAAMAAMGKAMAANGGAAPAMTPPAATAPATAAQAGATMPTQPVRDPGAIAMVQRLADRMEKAPGDVAGWQRLAHVYLVIGEVAKARTAADRAIALKPDDTGSLLALAEVQKAETPGEEAPKAYVATMRKVLQRDAANPPALYGVGLAEAKAGHGDKARELWTKALARVSPDDPLAGEIRNSLAILSGQAK